MYKKQAFGLDCFFNVCINFHLDPTLILFFIVKDSTVFHGSDFTVVFSKSYS